MPFVPAPRPKKEWEHVHVTKGGCRFVEVEELLSHDDAIATINAVAALTPVDPQGSDKTDRTRLDG